MANSIQINTVYTYDLDGVTVQFNVPFEYLSRNFVVVTLVGQDRKVLTNNTDYIFINSTTIQTLKPWGSTDGYQYIEVRRETSATDRLVDFQNGSVLRASDLNVSSIQSMHIAEEARDLVGTTMGVDLDGNLDARGKRVTNVADGVNPQDVVTIHQMDTWNASAKVQATIATQQATIATTKAGEAATSASKAATSATSAASSLTETKHQVDLATAQVGIATTQASIAITNAQTAHADAETATEQATIATEEAAKLVQFNDLTDRINSVAVSEVGEVLWHHSRNQMKIGCVPGDGQLLSRASYPTLWQMVVDGKVPVVADATWLADPASRGKYTTGNGSTTFRVPDYNGKYAGSIVAPVFRGDAGVIASNGVIEASGAPNIKGSFGTTVGGGGILPMNVSFYESSGSLLVDVDTRFSISNVPTQSGTTPNRLNIDASKSSPVYGRISTLIGDSGVRPNSIMGCYVIRVFGVVQNPGSFDAATVADQIDKLTDKVEKSASSGYVSQVIWHPLRSKPVVGMVPGDGQLLSRISYADLFAKVQAGEVPVVTDESWLQVPYVRSCYTLGDGSTTFRVPDYNGVFDSNSIPAPVLRGDGGSRVNGHMEMNGAPNITGNTGSCDNELATGGIKGAFYNFGSSNRGATNDSTGNILGFDASRVSPVYGRDGTDEVRMNTAIGCFMIRAYGEITNAGNLEVATLATDLMNLTSRVDQLDTYRSYALIETTSNIALNSRVVLTNPFGINTPVITQCEIFHATLQKWITTPWLYSTSSSIHGVSSSYSEGEGVVVVTAPQSFVAAQSGTSQTITSNYTTPSPIRVHVWKTSNQ